MTYEYIIEGWYQLKISEMCTHSLRVFDGEALFSFTQRHSQVIDAQNLKKRRVLCYSQLQIVKGFTKENNTRLNSVPDLISPPDYSTFIACIIITFLLGKITWHKIYMKILLYIFKNCIMCLRLLLKVSLINFWLHVLSSRLFCKCL